MCCRREGGALPKQPKTCLLHHFTPETNSTAQMVVVGFMMFFIHNRRLHNYTVLVQALMEV